MAESNLARPFVVPADEPLQDELAQFISEELHKQEVQLGARARPAATLIRRRFSARRIQIDDGGFRLFRVR